MWELIQRSPDLLAGLKGEGMREGRGGRKGRQRERRGEGKRREGRGKNEGEEGRRRKGEDPPVSEVR